MTLKGSVKNVIINVKNVMEVKKTTALLVKIKISLLLMVFV